MVYNLFFNIGVCFLLVLIGVKWELVIFKGMVINFWNKNLNFFFIVILVICLVICMVNFLYLNWIFGVKIVFKGNIFVIVEFKWL